MSDIVELLKETSDHYAGLLCEAADEIESLRARVAELEAEAKASDMNFDIMQREIEALRRRNNTLRNALKDAGIELHFWDERSNKDAATGNDADAQNHNLGGDSFLTASGESSAPLTSLTYTHPPKHEAVEPDGRYNTATGEVEIHNHKRLYNTHGRAWLDLYTHPPSTQAAVAAVLRKAAERLSNTSDGKWCESDGTNEFLLEANKAAGKWAAKTILAMADEIDARP